MEYLIPLAIFAALGILAGVLLTVASKVFAVEVDERVDAIAEALPQANCGACGFSGCADYADAIVNKGAECNLCRPGGEAAAKKNMHKVALKGTTIPHEIVGKYGAGAVLLKPAAPGTGMIAGGPVRAVIEAAGIKDVRAKSMRSNNPINVVSATFAGLCGLVSAESVAEKRGKTVKEILG